jgi:ceramide glucosyltransferase
MGKRRAEDMLTVILAILGLLSLLLTLWQWIVARRFPLHQRVADKSFSPAVTLLKPLKGCDLNTEKCLRSWLTQDYSGAVQVIFGVASADDPVCALVRKLMLEFPERDAELRICSQSLGPNAKVSTITQLQPHAKHDLLVISDADVRVPADFLVNVLAPLRHPDIGLVNCFYQLANPTTPALRWEAVAINADFWSQVLQARSLRPLDFALGAVMATTRIRLERMGGFAALLDYLADDYQLGHKITEQGGQIVLSPIVAECWAPPMNWKDVWTHQLRWARTIRTCQPLPYFLSILSNATLWPALWLAGHPTMSVSLAVIGCFVVRVLTALDNQRRLAPDTMQSGSWWLVLGKDLLSAGIWALAFLGNDVQWRGEHYRVLSGGQLIKRAA